MIYRYIRVLSASTFFLGFLSFLFVAHGVGQSSSGVSSGDPVVIKIGHVGHDHHLALYVAALESESRKAHWGVHLKELSNREVYDLYEGDRVVARLRFIQTGGGAAMPAAMTRGEIDIGLGGTAAIVKFADKGHPIRIICPLQSDGDQLVMRKGSSITNWAGFVAEAKADTRPLRIGYKEPMAVAKLILERALLHEGIVYGYEVRPGVGVELVNFGSEKSPFPLLESGALDGFVMNQPGTAIAVDKGLCQIVSELRDLPPDGMWHGHPCCSICATDTVLAEHPDEVKTLLKAIHLATDLINRDPPLAIDVAMRWIRTPREVAAQSIPTSSYRSYPGATWMRGMRTWHSVVEPLDFFTGKYATSLSDAFVTDVCRLELCTQAATELRQRGLIPDDGKKP